MVHLSHISDASQVDENLVQAVKKVHLQLSNDDDCFTTSVYGSRFAVDDLPKHEMPEREMPKEVAYRMIKDDLSLDGNPMLKSVLPLSVSCKLSAGLLTRLAPSRDQPGLVCDHVHGTPNRCLPVPTSTRRTPH